MSRRITVSMIVGLNLIGLVNQGLAATPLPVPPQSDLIQPLHENPDIERQVKGQYPTLERQESLPLGAIQHAWDQAGATAGVYQVWYHPSEIIRVRCREMMATTLVFPAWERIDRVVVGDPSAFKVETPKAHLILIQPQEFTGVDSNLTAIGASGKVYSFYLRSEGYNTKHVSDLTVYVRVRKPEVLPQTLTMKTTTKDTINSREGKGGLVSDYLEEATFDPTRLDFDFDMRGDVEIAPERVYSDGIRTWFDYGADIKRRTLPAVYSIVDDVDTPLNVNREGNTLVAQSAGRFTLRAGQKVVCVTPSVKP